MRMLLAASTIGAALAGFFVLPAQAVVQVPSLAPADTGVTDVRSRSGGHGGGFRGGYGGGFRGGYGGGFRGGYGGGGLRFGFGYAPRAYVGPRYGYGRPYAYARPYGYAAPYAYSAPYAYAAPYSPYGYGY